jgi:hypothetical protein
MSRKHSSFAIASLIGAGIAISMPLAASAGITQLMPNTVSHSQPAPSEPVTGLSSFVQTVDYRGRDRMRDDRRWNSQHGGKRCRTRTGGCRHSYNGYYDNNRRWLFAAPAINGGLTIGIYEGQNHGHARRHIAWCLNRYQSYNYRNNSWVSYSGQIRQCNSPY